MPRQAWWNDDGGLITLPTLASMALFHLATIKPTKAELIAAWAPTQPWGPSPDAPIEVNERSS